eukprot:TRINITY_DN30624_c0_g1_i1.p1 TRINITY_DN30624_c0_g1~~TRINITY_DN30624_c0_g1_i1.p1  ORF type:complete len:187 (+),score=13.08 TRINITY_DN30624_c0_g1_i1:68-628(+)
MHRSHSLRVRNPPPPQLDKLYYITDDDEDSEGQAEEWREVSSGFQKVTLRRSETSAWTPRSKLTLQTLLDMSYDRARVKHADVFRKLRTTVRPRDWTRRPKWLLIDLQHAIESTRRRQSVSDRTFDRDGDLSLVSYSSQSSSEPIIRKTRCRRMSSHSSLHFPRHQSDRELRNRTPLCAQPDCLVC